MSSSYSDFIARKSQLSGGDGFEPIRIPDSLFPFQRSLTEWAIRRGRAALFTDCGTGKSIMQLVWADNVAAHTDKPVLILTPLAVGTQTVAEAEKFGIDGVVRSRDGSVKGRIVVTNYEQLHKFNQDDFGGVVGDESSCIKHMGGATQKALTRFMSQHRYRLLCTATAAPNDYTELGTSSEALAELNHSEMLARFFRQLDNKGEKANSAKEAMHERAQRGGDHFAKLSYRVSQSMAGWRLKGHAVTPFWQWVASWARACRKPSDIGFSDDGFALPPLIERDHIITPAEPPQGMLFNRPAFGLKEEREERRRTLKERCELVAELVRPHKFSVIWCHLNPEGKLLERIIPNAIEVAGHHSDEYKEAAAEWFIGARCICNDKLFSAKLATWRKENQDTGNGGTKNIAKSALRNPSSTPSGTRKSDGRISPSTIKTINKNTSSRQSGRKEKTAQGAVDMGRTLSTESGISSPSNSGKRQTRANDSTNDCGNTELPQTTMAGSSASKAEDAAYAPAQHPETKEELGSTLTTTTRPESSEGCSAPIATMQSGNSGMTLTDVSEQQCICGHDGSRPRRLISKSRIFGFGLNLQHCAHVVTFATHSYEQHYQAVRRCWRFGQTSPVTVDVIATDGERHVRENMRRKSAAADLMFAELVTHMNASTKIERTNEYTKGMEAPSWL